jgi:DNA ligase-1
VKWRWAAQAWRRVLFCLLWVCAESVLAAPPILLAQVLGPDVDVTDYLVSEKYDGVRAIWDGNVLRFRSGREVMAPRWFLDRLPAHPLDGELWMGRERFEALSAAVRRSDPDDDEWRQIRYMVFELPGGEGTFAARAARIEAIVAETNWPALVAVRQYRVANRAELKRRLEDVVTGQDGQGGRGEGLMLHRADALYVTGRSDVLLKLKPQLDTEAVVVAHIPGQGRFRGMLGALRVEMPDGRRFAIGTGFNEATRRAPPAIGTTITYTYRGLTKSGLPRFASYLRVRDSF